MDLLIQRYLNSLTNQSEKTVSDYTRDLTMFNDYMDRENLTVLQATLDDLQGYAKYLKVEKEYSEATMNRRLQLVKYLYKYLRRTRVITENPSEYLELPKIPERIPESLTLNEAKKLIKVIDKGKNEFLRLRDRAMILIFLNHGLRVNEMTELKLQNINENTLKFIGKGNKERSIIMTTDVITAINDYLAIKPEIDSNYLFLSERKSPINKRTIQYMVEKYFKEAGLTGTVHDLRHTSASLMLENGIDPRTIQTLLGHSDIKTTELYMKVTDKRKEFAANQMEGLFTN